MGFKVPSNPSNSRIIFLAFFPFPDRIYPSLSIPAHLSYNPKLLQRHPKVRKSWIQPWGFYLLSCWISPFPQGKGECDDRNNNGKGEKKTGNDAGLCRNLRHPPGQGLSGQKQNFSWAVLRAFLSSSQRSLSAGNKKKTGNGQENQQHGRASLGCCRASDFPPFPPRGIPGLLRQQMSPQQFHLPRAKAQEQGSLWKNQPQPSTEPAASCQVFFLFFSSWDDANPSTLAVAAKSQPCLQIKLFPPQKKFKI